MTTATFKKIAAAQPVGQYKPTSVDAQKAAADFLLKQVAPYYITWKDGKSEYVTAAKLAKLQASHTWATDF